MTRLLQAIIMMQKDKRYSRTLLTFFFFLVKGFFRDHTSITGNGQSVLNSSISQNQQLNSCNFVVSQTMEEISFSSVVSFIFYWNNESQYYSRSQIKRLHACFITVQTFPSMRISVCTPIIQINKLCFRCKNFGPSCNVSFLMIEVNFAPITLQILEHVGQGFNFQHGSDRLGR